MSGKNQETEKLSLFAILLGSTPQGRNIEQHDMMFGVAKKLDDLIDRMKRFWHAPVIADLAARVSKLYPQVDKEQLQKDLLPALIKRDAVHIDAWTRVDYVDGYKVVILPKELAGGNNGLRLFFINLGGYKQGEFEELHRKFFVVAANVSEAMKKAKAHEFMKEYAADNIGKGATPHLDDQHKIDFEADDIICVSDQLDNAYVLQLEQVESHPENELVIGYVKLNYN